MTTGTEDKHGSDTPHCTAVENSIDSNDARAWRTLAYKLEGALNAEREPLSATVALPMLDGPTPRLEHFLSGIEELGLSES